MTHPDDLPFSISLRRVNKGVGYVALLLPLWLLLVSWLTETCFYASVSHYYFSRIGGDIFVGSLSFIGVLLSFFYTFRAGQIDGYLQHRWYDIWLVKLAGLSAFVIAFSPTTGSGCAYDGTQVARVFITDARGSEGFHPPGDTVSGTIGYDFWASFAAFGTPEAVPAALAALHFGAAAAMFAILGYFSFSVFVRGNSSTSRGPVQPGSRKARRNRWYRGLGIAIFFSIAALGVKFGATEWVLDAATAEAFVNWWDGWRLTFLFEATALMSFGLSWMIKGRFLSAFEDETVLRAGQGRAA